MSVHPHDTPTGSPLDTAAPLAHHRRTPPGAAGSTGAPVVLLHAGVADHRMWSELVDVLADDTEVVTVDLRGFGESATMPTGAWSHVADVATTLDALGVRAAAVVGCSLGAGVAAELAVSRPELVSRLLLVAPGGPLIAEATDELRTFGRAEHEALVAGDVEAAVAANVRAWVDGSRAPDEAGLEPVRERVREMQARAFELQLAWPDEVFEAEEELDPPVLDRLGAIAVPTTVLVGDLDLDAIRATAGRVAAGVPGATLERWPDVAHLPPVEQPARFAELVRSWLA